MVSLRKNIMSTLNIYLLLLFTFICDCFCNDPLKFSTNECALTEPVYGYIFNFTALRSDLGHLVTGQNGDTIEYNICGKLLRGCDGDHNVTACLKRGNKEYILGKETLLSYRNGRMFFSFGNGTTCQRNGKTSPFSLTVFVDCDYTLDKNQSHLTTYEDDSCTFYMTLETPQACLPAPKEVESNSCSVKDPVSGHTYDLLSLSDFNYRTTDRAGSAFVINICKPVLYTENAMCPPGSSICFVSLNATDYKKKFFDYGSAQANPIIENGQLLLRHTSNTRCNTTDNYSSIIHFYCDMSVKNSHPVLIGVHGCVYEFSFVTPLACNTLVPCTAITHGNEIIDMSPLKDKPFTLQMQNKSYTFAVCSNAGTPCLENDGACYNLNGQSVSIGRANSNLRFNKTGSPYLLYENGAKCQKSDDAAATTTTNWSTKIEFVCANNATKDNGSAAAAGSAGNAGTALVGPKIIENSNCQLLIHYQTALACQEQITCKAKAYVDYSEDGSGTSEEVVDLTPLISANENYEAKINTATISEQQVGKTTKFYLNVCRPLVPKFGLGCQGGSAACTGKMASPTATLEEELSLGFPLASLVAFNRTTAELRYLQGSVCPSDKTSQLSAGIEFYCDMRAGRGTPVLQTIQDCHYQFTWATNVICPAHMCNFNAETCEINNDEINVRYNLKKAPYTDNGKIKTEMDKNQFTLDICGTKHSKAVTDYTQGLVNLFFATQGACGVDGLVNVQMRLICSGVEERATTFSDNKQCNLIHTQRTPDICKFLGLAIPTVTISSTTTTTTTTTTLKTPTVASSTTATNTAEPHPAEHAGNIGTILAAILSLTMFVACFGTLAFSPERRNSLRRLFRRSTSAVRYSRVQSNEEANLLLEPNGEFTDSDDDMLL